MNHLERLSVGLAATLLAASAAAQSLTAAATPLATELSLVLIVPRDDGKEAQLPATQVKPGDTVQYSARYHNQGQTALAHVVASLPVPQGTQLVRTQPDDVQASLDGKTFARLPLMRRVQQADGGWQEVPVPLAEIRYVRWPARTLAAGEQFNASLRVRVTAAGL